jgi:hypothetical protein
MTTFQKFLIGLASFTCISALSTFIYLLAMQSTILDRTVVKDWLSESQLYEGKLISGLIQPAAADSNQGAFSLSPDVLNVSLAATLTPDFIRTQTESVIDNAYDWIEGKTPAFTFSIPLDQKRDTFIQQLSKALEPQIATLPVCGAVPLQANAPCRPSTMTVEQFSHLATAQSAADSNLFTEPLTNQSFAQSSQTADFATLSQLPVISKIIDWLLILLPILVIICVTAVLVITPRGRRLIAAAHLSRRACLSMLFILIPSATVAWIANGNNLNLASLFPAQTGEVFVPLVKVILVGILSKLALISGIAAAMAGAIWAGIVIWRRNTPSFVPSIQAPASEDAQVSPGINRQR